MKVLFFSSSLGVHEQRFLRVLASSRHDMFFLALDQKTNLSGGLTGVTQVFWPQERNVQRANLICRIPALLDILENLRPDIIHAGPVQTCGFLTVLSEYCPSIIMSWGSDVLVENRHRFHRWVSQFTLRHTDFFVCDADCVRIEAERLRGFPFEKCVQFPWGVDLKQFRPAREISRIRRALGWNDCFVLVSCRNWEAAYDPFVALIAFAEAYRNFPTLRLFLLSSGSLAPDIERFISDRGLEQVIHRPGRIKEEDLADYFQAADLYVSSAPSDGSSISLLQAFAAGLPVVVADAPGNREWVNQENGWFAQIGSSGSYEKCIRAALNAGMQVLETMGLRNREVAERRADWNVNSGKLLKMYDDIELEITKRKGNIKSE